MANFGYKKMFDGIAPHEIKEEDIDKLNNLATIMSGQSRFLDATSPVGFIGHIRRFVASIFNFFTDNTNPIELTIAPSPVENTLEQIPAGYTYLAQFICHDITFDQKSDRELVEHRPWDVMDIGTLSDLRNLRKPSFDLETIYGYEESDVPEELFPRPEFEPFRQELMQEHSLPLLKLGTTLQKKYPCDLFRKDGNVTAHIVDPRNDENLLLAQTQTAFTKFHNAMVAKLSESGKYRTTSGEYKKKELFDKARKLVIRYYQKIILTDFLPKIIRDDILKDVEAKAGTDELIYQPQRDGMFIPLEFTVAAFRFGHSMIKSSYKKFNKEQNSALLNNIMMFTGKGKMGGIITGKKLPDSWIVNWRSFYKIDGNQSINNAEPINTELVLEMLQLRPHIKNGNDDGRASSIAALDLFRGRRFRLPTGQAVAETLNVPISERLTSEDLKELIMKKNIAGAGADEANRRRQELVDFFSKETPLWFYILAEAELQKNAINAGKLGAVGSRIVAETIIQLLYYSEYSILREPVWETHEDEPNDGFRLKADGTFGMPEMLKFIKETSEDHFSFSLLYPNMTETFDELNPLGEG